MRLLTFKAATLRQAMTLARRELGDEATIVSTQTDPETGAARIVASRAQNTRDPRLGQVAMAPEQRADQVLETLLLHGVPMNLADRLAQAVADMEPRTPIAALTGALALDFNFSPVDVTADNQRLILVGPPGAGKTLALVKLAARALMAKRSVQLLTTDLKRAGAVEQLTAFAKVMGQEVFITETADELAQFMARTPKRTLVLVDSPGINHRSQTEMDDLFDFVNAAPAEPVLVMNAGMDVMEAADAATAFSALGVKRMLVTRTDATGRMGAILTAMESADLALAGTTGSADPINGFFPMSAPDLSDLLYGEVLSLNAELTIRGAAAENEDLDDLIDGHEVMINVALPAEG
ncbi:MAG: GTPase [Rhodospirillales bacterium]